MAAAHVGQPSPPVTLQQPSRQLPPLKPNDNLTTGEPKTPSAPSPLSTAESPYGYVPPIPPHYAYRTQVVVNYPGVVAPTFRYDRIQNVRQWSSGLCGCCQDCASCCCALWCYPCFTCQLATQAGECMCGPYCCGAGLKCVPVLQHLLFCGPNPVVVALRTKLRTKYAIEGSICDDVICVCCCECCVATQIYRELKYQGALYK